MLTQRAPSCHASAPMTDMLTNPPPPHLTPLHHASLPSYRFNFILSIIHGCGGAWDTAGRKDTCWVLLALRSPAWTADSDR